MSFEEEVIKRIAPELYEKVSILHQAVEYLKSDLEGLRNSLSSLQNAILDLNKAVSELKGRYEGIEKVIKISMENEIQKLVIAHLKTVLKDLREEK